MSEEHSIYLPCGRCGHLRILGDTPSEESTAAQAGTCSTCDSRIVLGAVDDDSRIIDEFAIIRKIGAGGAATVYLANQVPLDRNVALKIGHSSDPDEVKALMSEARMAAKVSHPNIVQVYKFGTWQGLWYLAMEYVECRDLKEVITFDGPMPWRQALDITLQIANGLEAAWTEVGIVHRDVKPENILLPEKGPVKLVDLGLAVSQTAEMENESLAGTPHFMSPEQFRSEKLDVRSDLYSLGITLYYMLTGVYPYDGRNPVELGRKHMTAPIPNVNDTVDVPDAVNALVLRMMAKSRDSRFSIFALIDVLEYLLQEADAESGETVEVVEEYDETTPVRKSSLGGSRKRLKAERLRTGKRQPTKKRPSTRRPDTSKVRLPAKKRPVSKKRSR